MFSVKHAIIIGVILIIIYLLYNYNKSKKENQQNVSENQLNKEEKEDSDTTEYNKLGVYYTDWCGYSKQFLKQLESGLYDELKKNDIDVVLVDCEKNKDVCNAMGVEGFPTLILHTSKGNRVYNGQRDLNSILQFVKG
jgi:thiol-disulfide isomerase/thioredoxin